MDLIDLKMNAKEKKKEMQPVKTSGPNFPYGFTLNIESEQMKKFPQLKAAKGGDKFKVVGIAKVKSWDTSGQDDGTERASVTLQLTKIGIEPIKANPLKDTMSEAMRRSQKGIK